MLTYRAPQLPRLRRSRKFRGGKTLSCTTCSRLTWRGATASLQALTPTVNSVKSRRRAAFAVNESDPVVNMQVYREGVPVALFFLLLVFSVFIALIVLFIVPPQRLGEIFRKEPKK